MRNTIKCFVFLVGIIPIVFRSAAQTVTGSGTVGTVPVLTGSSTIGNSVISQSGGNIGIGTSTPGSLLDLTKNGTGISFDPVGYGNFYGALAFNREVLTGAIYSNKASAYQFIHVGSTSPGSDYLTLQVYSSTGGNVQPQAFVVNGYGNVGIGTTTPGASLEVDGSVKLTSGSGGFIFADGSVQTSAYTSSSGVSSVIGPSSAVTGAVTLNGSGVSQSGNTFTFGGGAGTYFALSPSGSQTVTLPSGASTLTTQSNIYNGSLTQNPDQFFSYPAGWNNGGSFNGNGDWLTILGNGVNQLCAHAGICDVTSGAFTHSGSGDTFWNYGYVTAWGGLTNANDEGVGGNVVHVDQACIFYGPAITAGTGLSLISVTGPSQFSYGNGCTQNSYNWQQFPVGGFMIDSAKGSGPLTVSAVGNADGAIEYTLSSGTVTASTAIGTISSCTSSLQGKYGVYGTQVCTVNVVSGAFVSGQNIYHIGRFEEEDAGVTVSGSGRTQTVTMTPTGSVGGSMYPFNVGEFIGQGGPGGSFLTSYVTGTGVNASYFVGGAIDSTHLLFGNCVTGACGSGGNIIAPSQASGLLSLGRSGGTVTATFINGTANINQFSVGETVTMTGAVPSDLNGTFTILTSTRDATNPLITWAQAGATETSTSDGTIVPPLPQIQIYPGAEICGTDNGTIGSANLCTNHMTVASGDPMTAPQSSQWTGEGMGVYMSQTGPASGSAPSKGVFVVDQGPTPLFESYFAGNNISYGPSPTMFNIQGSYSNVFNIGYRPANNGTLFYVGGNEPVSPNTKPYYLVQDNHSFLSILMNPSSDSFTFGNGGAGSIVASSYTAGTVTYTGTTAAASNCGSLSGSAGCIVVSIGGATHYVPYW
jgi:hypothetical protein